MTDTPTPESNRPESVSSRDTSPSAHAGRKMQDAHVIALAIVIAGLLISVTIFLSANMAAGYILAQLKNGSAVSHPGPVVVSNFNSTSQSKPQPAVSNSIVVAILGSEGDENSQIVQAYVNYFEKSGLNISDVNLVDYTSAEGQAIIGETGLEYVPAVLIFTNQNLNETALDLFTYLAQQGALAETDAYYYSPISSGEYIGPLYDHGDLEVFIMSYCPYGLQMQKAVIPVMELFQDSDDVDIELKFVYYAMHPTSGEVEENTRQYCIQKEQPEVFLGYLTCFVEAGDSEGCLNSTGVDREKLDACYAAADEEFLITENLNDKSLWLNGYYPRYNVNLEENTRYEVGGSPTLVFNGKEVSWPRTPEAIKENICSMLENPPAECQQELSTSAPGTRWGAVDDYSGGSASTGSCE